MLRGVKILLCSALLTALLGACAMIDIVDPRYDSVNRSTAKARNESILLNIIRASHSTPLNFVTFTRVSGSMNVSASAALPAFNLGPFFPLFPGASNVITALAPPTPQRAFGLSNQTLGGSTNAGNNYDIGLLETKDFYTGLLRPVDLPIVNFFIRQGYSRELLFWLFADSVRETALGRTVEFVNDPDPALACAVTNGLRRCFSDMVDIALASGLTIEEKIEETSAAGSTSGSKEGTKKSGSAKTGDAKTGDAKTGDGKATDTKTGGGKTANAKSTDKSGNRIIARFCFDQVLADRAKKEYSPEIFRLLATTMNRPRCRIDPWPQRNESDTLEFTFEGSAAGTIKFEIVPRSGFGIYQYLGHILALHQEKTFRMRGKLFPVEDTRILAVERSGTGGCLVDVNFEDEYYCVPLHGAENTKRIMGLLAQLVALNTTTQDLAITPTVRAIQ
jgi:hypothetical protein